MTTESSLDRLLLYSVGGQLYASPLDDFREVIELPARQGSDVSEIHGHEMEVWELSEILGEDQREGDGSGPLLVVEVGESILGLRAHIVRGMIMPEKVFPLPPNISELPAGSVVGAMVTLREHGRMDDEPVERDAPAAEVDAWETRGEDSPSIGQAYDIVVILDLKKIASGIMETEKGRS